MKRPQSPYLKNLFLKESVKEICRVAGEVRYDGGINPRPFQKGATGAEVPFHNSIIGKFIVYSRSTCNKFVAAIRAPRKFRKVFWHFCHYFWSQHCCWTETSILV